jgi:hypothetical protein
LYRRWRALPEEVRFLGRLAIYALGIGVAYWFVSYEAAGTVLLIGFGIATGGGFVVLWRGSRRGAAGASVPASDPGSDPGASPDGPFGDESGPVPSGSLVPLEVGFGIAVIGLGLVFGPWLILAGVVPFLAGAWSWLGAAGREIDR